MVFFVHVLSSDFPNVGITRLYIGCLVVFTGKNWGCLASTWRKVFLYMVPFKPFAKNSLFVYVGSSRPQRPGRDGTSKSLTGHGEA